MPNLMGVTNPVPGADSSNINRQLPSSPGANTNIQNAPDLNRISRPDMRTEQQGSGDATGPGGALRYDSNFQTFLQRLQNTPELTRTLAEIMLSYKSVVSSGLNQGIAAEMSQLLQMLPMDEKGLGQFLAQQLGDAKFKGPLFALLREAYATSQSEGIRGDILQFLKRYGDYAGSRHIENGMLRTLTQLNRYLPASYGSTLMQLAEQLAERFAAGDRAGAMKLLQQSILPHLANYTETTHDMGTSRNLISQLALDISRYENGSVEGLLQSFKQLSGHAGLRERLDSLSSDMLLNLINKENQQASQNQFANQLAKAAEAALKGSAGLETQEAFKQIMQAMLVNQSVYMPLQHALIPLDWQGKMAFSELWVDPDADDSLNRGGGRSNSFRLLLKLDIQGLGFFDMVIASRGEDVELLVSCPEQVAPFSGLIQGELGRIISENGLNPTGIQVVKMQQPLTISAVFPKIFEGENSINVSI